MLRNPTKVPKVAINGGNRTIAISQVCRVPTRKPTASVPRIARMMTPVPTGCELLNASGFSRIMSVAHTVPPKAIIEPADRSIPPAMITIAEPSETIPSIAAERAMFFKLKSGSFQ